MCDKAVDKCPFVFDSVPDQYKTQEMCDKLVSEDPVKLEYSHNRYKTQEMCNKAVDNFLSALKFVTDWFVTSKIIKKLLTALYADDNILYFNEDAGDVVFSCNEIGILSIGFNKINLDDTLQHGILEDGGIFACQKMKKNLLSNAFNASIVFNMKALEDFDKENYA